MKQLAESLKRLFNAGRIQKEKITELYQNDMITEDEMYYILGDD